MGRFLIGETGYMNVEHSASWEQSAKRRAVDARRMGMGKLRVESYEFRGAVRRLRSMGGGNFEMRMCVIGTESVVGSLESEEKRGGTFYMRLCRGMELITSGTSLTTAPRPTQKAYAASIPLLRPATMLSYFLESRRYKR